MIPLKIGGVAMPPLRYPRQLPTLTTLAVTMALQLYRCVLNHYCSGRIAAMDRWYANDIRLLYLDIGNTGITEPHRVPGPFDPPDAGE